MTILMHHPFFKGIDFQSDLSKLGIKEILEKTSVLESEDDEEVEEQPEPLNLGIRAEAK